MVTERVHKERLHTSNALKSNVTHPHTYIHQCITNMCIQGKSCTSICSYPTLIHSEAGFFISF
jgi:hypothetical protein